MQSCGEKWLTSLWILWTLQATPKNLGSGKERNSWLWPFEVCSLGACTRLSHCSRNGFGSKRSELPSHWSDTPSQVTSIEADDYTYNSAMKSLSATGDRARVVDPVDPVSSKWGDRHEISDGINGLIDVFSKTRCEALVGYANGLAIWRVNHGWAAIKPFWLQIIIHNHTCGYLRILFV